MKSRTFFVTMLMCLLLTPNLTLASKGQLKYDVSYTSIFPPITSKQVIARYLLCDNPFFGGVLRKVTLNNGDNYQFNYDSEGRVTNITAHIGSRDYSTNYTYDTVHPEHIVQQISSSVPYGNIVGSTRYVYNANGPLIKEFRGDVVYATHKITKDGLRQRSTYNGKVIHILGNQQPSDIWSLDYYRGTQYETGKPISYSTYTYDSKGHVIQQESYSRKSLQPLAYERYSKTTYTYNAAGKLRLKRLYRGDGTHIGKSTYEYDEQKRLIKSTEYRGPVSTYEYAP